VARTSQSPSCEVEVWIGAGDGQGFIRHLVAHFDAVDTERPDEEPLESQLQAAVDEGAGRADKLTPTGLTLRHVFTATAKEPSTIRAVGQPIHKMYMDEDRIGELWRLRSKAETEQQIIGSK
jgi:hypothetical protein